MAKATQPKPPTASVNETVDEIVAQSGRDYTPLRPSFLQLQESEGPGAGPLASFVTNGDLGALLLYLLAVTKASSDPWDTALAAPVWARALGFDLFQSRTATSTISKMWKRLEDRRLIRRERYRRMAHIFLLREDGSGEPYELPALAGDQYLRVPTELWCGGPSEDDRWYRVLTLPEIAMLLIALSLRDEFRLPFEDVPSWYGISADTASRGLHGLARHGLLKIDKSFKKAPLAPAGYTAENRYTLQPPFGPKGAVQRSRRQR